MFKRTYYYYVPSHINLPHAPNPNIVDYRIDDVSGDYMILNTAGETMRHVYILEEGINRNAKKLKGKKWIRIIKT